LGVRFGVALFIGIVALSAVLVGVGQPREHAPAPALRAAEPLEAAASTTPAQTTQPRAQLALADSAHVPLEGSIPVRFSQPMDVEYVDRHFRLAPATDGTLAWDDSSTLVFHPTALLLPGTTYRVLVSGMSESGRTLVTDANISFRTISPPSVPFPFTLTFDDCASPGAIGAILAALADRGLHAIFFPTGLCRDANPWLIPTLLAAGHRVCNHSYSHPYLTRLSNAAIRSEISRGVSAGGCDLFRPPYGDVNPRVAAIVSSMGYRIQLWDVDTRDWAGTSAAEMVAKIRARGGVVLMHMHGVHTVEAIEDL
jgi:hypothetical protein